MIADRQQCRTDKAERTPRLRPVGRDERRPDRRRYAASRMRSGGRPQRLKPPLQPARDGDKAGSMSGCPADPPARDRIGRNQVEVVAARRDHDGPTEHPAQQYRRNAVRIEIMRIDQVEIPAIPDLSPQQRQGCGENRQRRRIHPDLRQQRITRMIDFDPVPSLAARRARERRIGAEFRRRKREPGARRDDPGGHGAALDKLAQPCFDKDPVRRPRGARVQCRECQNLQAVTAQLPYPG